MANKRDETDRTRVEESRRILAGIGQESAIGGFTEASVRRSLHAMGEEGTGAPSQPALDASGPDEAAAQREAELEAMAQKWGRRLAYIGILGLIFWILVNFGIL